MDGHTGDKVALEGINQVLESGGLGMIVDLCRWTVGYIKHFIQFVLNCLIIPVSDESMDRSTGE